MERKISITHPKLGELQFLPESLSVWERRGWVQNGKQIEEEVSQSIVAEPVIVEETEASTSEEL